MKCETLRKRGTGHAAIAAARMKVKRDRAALEAGLSAPMVTWARRICAFGVPELVAAVEDGRVALFTAARVSRWAPDAQREFLLTADGTDRTPTMRQLTAFYSQKFTSGATPKGGVTLSATVSATAEMQHSVLVMKAGERT